MIIQAHVDPGQKTDVKIHSEDLIQSLNLMPLEDRWSFVQKLLDQINTDEDSGPKTNKAIRIRHKKYLEEKVIYLNRELEMFNKKSK